METASAGGTHGTGGQPRVSYRDSVHGNKEGVDRWGMEVEDEGAISDDDMLEECEDGSCISIGMTREAKIEARRP